MSSYRPSDDPRQQEAHDKAERHARAVERDGYFPGIPRISSPVTPPPPTIGPDEEDDDDGIDDDHQ